MLLARPGRALDVFVGSSERGGESCVSTRLLGCRQLRVKRDSTKPQQGLLWRGWNILYFLLPAGQIITASLTNGRKFLIVNTLRKVAATQYSVSSEKAIFLSSPLAYVAIETQN